MRSASSPAAIAHDFNNLLTAILGYSEVVASKVRHDPKLSGHVEQISRAGEAAAGLTRQLLAFSRRQMLQPDVLDLNGVLANVDTMLRRLIGEHIDLVIELAPDLRWVRADAGQLEQVIVNLAVNARDAMKVGGQLKLETRNIDLAAGNPVWPSAGRRDRAHRDRHRLRDRRRDAGARLRAVLHHEGAGQGHGSRVVDGLRHRHAERRCDRGRQHRRPGHDVPHRPARRGRGRGRGDDDRRPAGAARARRRRRSCWSRTSSSSARLAKLALEGAGYTVLAAASPEEALRAASGMKRIDLILTDVIMPMMNGRDLADRLVQRHPRAKVLFMSGYTDDMLLANGVAVRELAFIHKPFTPTSLVQRVREVLDSTAAEMVASSPRGA